MRKIIIFALFISAVYLNAATDVSGSISSNTTWTASGDSTYRIVGDIIVEPGVTLTIQPGVKVYFTGVDTFRVLINGNLNAIGTVIDSIIFSHETPGQKHFSLDFINASSSSTLEYCRIQDGIAPNDGSYGGSPYDRYGGGILINNSPVSVQHCLIQYNTARYGGGIFVLSSSSVNIENNIIKNNTGNLYGGGIGFGSANFPVVQNNIIMNNTMTGGGGAGLSFANNVDIELVNNLIYQNSARGSGGGGLLIISSGNSIAVQNCIFWGNSATGLADELQVGAYSADITVDYTDVEGGYTGTGNINLDPLFIDAASYDFHLSESSPCIDAGTSTGSPATDFDGNPTNQDGDNSTTTEYDMGCFEFLQEVQSTFSSGVPVDYNMDTFESGTPNTVASVTLNGTVTGAGEITVNCFTKSQPLNAPTGSKSIHRWYRISETGTLSYDNANLRLYYTSDENPDNLNGTNLTLWRRNGLSWQQVSGTITPGANYVQIDGISQAQLSGDWAFSDPTDSPLPVELISFNAIGKDNSVDLKWSTNNEINNLGFIILRSVKEEGNYLQIDSWETNKLLEGAGNSSERIDYLFTDNNVYNGQTYFYKLYDVDMNGIHNELATVYCTPHAGQIDIDPLTAFIPKTFMLRHNYPNPFNPSTKIRFDIPIIEQGLIDVKISVFNVLGQRIKTLLESPLVPGSYEIEWDGTNSLNQLVPSGFYVYKFESTLFNDTQKMILMK